MTQKQSALSLKIHLRGDNLFLIPTNGSYPIVLARPFRSDRHVLENLNIYFLAREKGLQIISIGKKFDWADRNIIAPSPFRWMGYIKNADFVFTCMFHGLLFYQLI